MYGADWDGEIVHDPLQKARVTFLRTPAPSDALIELVEPAGEGRQFFISSKRWWITPFML